MNKPNPDNQIDMKKPSQEISDVSIDMAAFIARYGISQQVENLFKEAQKLTVQVLISAGKREEKSVSKSELAIIDKIISKMGVQRFGWDYEEGPSAQDLLDTVQYVINHGSIEADYLHLSAGDILFLKTSGFFSL